jgi:phospholipid/cholesterol/gamma-HCH transport system substrate-binding protein
MRKRRISTFKAGLIGIILLVVFTYLGFTKFANPLANPYTVHALFSNGNELRPDSFVRIAGINVGKVQSVQPATSCAGQPKPCSAADVTLQMQPIGLPLHKDATFAIRPRIFLEGNFFVDVHPGSPSAPIAPTGFTFPIQQGVEPVQFDQVLTSLQSDTRHKGGPAYNRSVQYWLPAYEYTSIVNHDALGLQPHDLSGYIDKSGLVAAAIDHDPQSLKNLITDLNTTARALAVQNVALQNAVHELPTTLSTAMPAFAALNNVICSGPAGPKPPNCGPGALPNLAKALLPGVRNTNAMITASLPLLSQIRQLVQPSELQGLSRDLRGAIPALARLTVETIPFMRNQVRPASSCTTNNIIPWSHLTVPDSHFNASNGFPSRQTYVEAVDFLPGLAGESRNFDSNGPFIRVGSSVGASLTYTLANGFFGQAIAPILGAQPQLPPGNKRPVLAGGDAPNSPCETQAPTLDLSAPEKAGPTVIPQSITNPTLPGITVPTVPTPTLPGPLAKDKATKR